MDTVEGAFFGYELESLREIGLEFVLSRVGTRI